MRVANENLLVIDGAAATTSLGASLNMRPIWLGHIANYSIQIFFSGTPSGTFKLQISNDVGQPQASGDAQKYNGVSNWTDVADSSISVSAAGDVAWEVQNSGSEWVRVVYTRSASTGTITSARAKLKGV